MHLIAETLDDLLIKTFRRILEKGERVYATKGWNSEISAIVLELRNPLARLSRTETKGTAFSCIGETLWYLAKSNKLNFIEYYLKGYGKFAEADGTVHGAYGPRLFDMRGKVDQISNVIKLLKKKPSSRQAIIQLFNAEDLLRKYNDIPCTCTIQFFVRRGSLNVVVHSRRHRALATLIPNFFLAASRLSQRLRTLSVAKPKSNGCPD